jgi:hypothetical protein
MLLVMCKIMLTLSENEMIEADEHGVTTWRYHVLIQMEILQVIFLHFISLDICVRTRFLINTHSNIPYCTIEN